MPIKGLTDVHQFGAGLPRIGTLYKGDEKPEQGNRPGKDLQHFRFEADPQFEYLTELWNELYSNEPTEFSPVFLFGNSANEAFETWLEEWSATGLQHRCDGEMQTRWYDRSIGEYSVARIDCDAPQCQCKRTGRLRLVFPDFVEAAGVLGYIAMTTHSIHDIMTLHRYLADIARLYGKLEGVPFVFGRAAREVSAPKPQEVGKRIKTTKSLLYMHVLPDFTRDRLVNRISQPEQPSLPSRVIRASEEAQDGEIIDLETTHQRKATERTQRRIGAPARPEWWQSFSESMFQRFNLEEIDIDAALIYASGWQEDKRLAQAACIAMHCQYDPTCVETYTSANKFTFETFEAALKVISAYRQIHPEAEVIGE